MKFLSQMTFLLLTLSSMLASSLAWGAGKACFSVGLEPVRLKSGESYFEAQPARVVSFQHLPAQGGKPTLIFLPGVFRGMDAQDAAVQSLAKAGFGILRTTTSSHWESLKGLEPAEATQRSKQASLDPSNADYARETEVLVRHLKIDRPLALSLSYSSAMASEMKLPQIFVAPLVKASDSNPSGAAALRSWESLMAMNPFLGKSMIRSNRDSNYHSFWSGVVDANLKANPKAYGENADRKLIIDSYIQLSRATEDFDLSKVNFEPGRPVSFVLGEFESQVRLKGQIQTVIRAAEVAPTRLILIRQAEHNVPDSQPVAFHRAIEELTQRDSSAGLQVGVIDPRLPQDQIQWLREREIQKLFETVLDYSDATSSSDLSVVLGK